jgi:hypothetical protein
MKLPSLRELFSDSLRTVIRFPLVVFISLLGVISALILIDYEGPPGTSILFNIAYVSLPGIPLFLALALTAEKLKWKRRFIISVHAAGVIFLLVYAATLPSFMIETPASELVRLMLMTLAFYFLAMYSPFATKGSIIGFWHYNKILCFRFLLSFLYSTVLYTGLTLALLAVNNLFNFDIQPKRYGELAVFIYGFINIIIFLRGIPDDLDALDSLTEYPKGLKIFVQYILLPLAAVYLLIIYAYAVKMLFSWSWPQGWISRMILGFSMTGFLSLLFLYPIHGRQENNWMRNVFRIFFISMIPLLILYPLALFRRISEYGMTENRYIAVVLAIWLTLMILYFIFSKGRNIKAVPVTLFIITIITIVGPWNMFILSERSQFRRLEAILTHSGIVMDGHISKTTVPVSADEKKNISSIITYLHDKHGYGMIRPWFNEDLQTIETGSIASNLPPDQVVKKLGVDYVNVREGGMSNTMMLTTDQDFTMNIEGYQTLIRTQYVHPKMKEKKYPDQLVSYRISDNFDTLLFFADRESTVDTVRFNLHELAERMQQEFGNSHIGNIPQEKMSLVGTGRKLKAKLFFKSLQTRSTEGKIQITSCAVDIAYTD